MSEKPESSEFDEDEADGSVDSDDPQLEHLIKDLESQKRRGSAKPGEPAWRRLEKYMERKRTAELLSDFADYDLGDGRVGGALAGDATSGDEGDAGAGEVRRAQARGGRRKSRR